MSDRLRIRAGPVWLPLRLGLSWAWMLGLQNGLLPEWL